jgi:hypothetical protein
MYRGCGTYRVETLAYYRRVQPALPVPDRFEEHDP